MNKLLRKYRLLLLITLIPNLIIIFLCVYRTNNEVLMVGDLTKINTIIDIETDKVEEGSFNSIYVYQIEKITLIQSLVLNLTYENDVSEITNSYAHFSQSQLNQMGVIQKNQSIEASIILAYHMASKNDPQINLNYSFKGLIVRYITKKTSNIQIGDIITKINEVEYTNFDSFKNTYNNIQIGDKVTLLRNNKEVNITIEENDYRQFLVYNKYQIDYQTSFPKITLNTIRTQGPSAGLLQTLSNYNKLVDKDYTKGLKIAGTGTIDEFGKVGIIGGIKQKVIAAKENKADIFFCPEGNYEEGKKAYDKLKNKETMKFVKVSTIDDAIRYLENV